MRCREWEERIADEDPGASGHLAECEGCREFADGLRRTIAALRTAHAEEIAPAHYAAVRARVLAEARPRRRWGLVWAAAGVAAAVVAGVSVDRRLRVEELDLRVPTAARSQGLPLTYGRVSERGVVGARGETRKAAPKVRRAEEIVVKIETGNPDVVIYWIAEAKGEE